MTQLQLANFDQSKELKIAGFDWEVNNYFELDQRLDKRIERQQVAPRNYNATEHSLSCPTIQLALKWMRDKHRIYTDLFHSGGSSLSHSYTFRVRSYRNKVVVIEDTEGSSAQTYDLAESACLDECIKILKEQKP